MSCQRFYSLIVVSIGVIHADAGEVVGHFIIHLEIGLESWQHMGFRTAVNDEELSLVGIGERDGYVAAIEGYAVEVGAVGLYGLDGYIRELHFLRSAVRPSDDTWCSGGNSFALVAEECQRSVLFLRSGKLHQLAIPLVCCLIGYREGQTECLPSVRRCRRALQNHFLRLKVIEGREAILVVENQFLADAVCDYVIGGLTLAGRQIDDGSLVQTEERRVGRGAVNGKRP